MAAATSLVLGSVGNLRFRFGEEGSYAGGSASTGASCICVFLALGLDGPLLSAPLGRPLALGFITGFTSSSTTGSGSSSALISAILLQYPRPALQYLAEFLEYLPFIINKYFKIRPLEQTTKRNSAQCVTYLPFSLYSLPA